MLKRQYMGGGDERKKAKPANRGKFVFDWNKEEDTSRDLNPLYDKPHEVAPMFGRGMLAGMDRGEQARAQTLDASESSSSNLERIPASRTRRRT